jgi:WD40 repeat protein
MGFVRVLQYVHIIWSPDGQRLALTFDTVSAQPSVNGVELVNRDDGHAQVLLQQQFPTAPFYAEWDLAQSRPVPFTPPLSVFSLMPLPPALAYRWGTNGNLVPETLLTPTTVPAVPPPGPVGNPDGDPSFTIWQPGSMYVVSFAESFHLYTWSTDFAAWSPDGRYLVDGIALFGLLKPPGRPFPDPETLVMHRENQEPLLPIHDKAFLKVIDTATVLTWNPNGHVLAAYNTGKSVDLYDCLSGDRLASFVLQNKNAASPADAPLLRWSPDGSHLLISSVLWGLVTLLGPNQLLK